MDAEHYRTCTTCGVIWHERDDFLNDPNVELVGYQVNYFELELGFLLFNHSCGTTLTIQVKDVRDLYDGPVYDERLTGTEVCPGYCAHKSELKPCPNKCECSFVREILQIVKKWPKAEDEK